MHIKEKRAQQKFGSSKNAEKSGY